MIACAKEPDKSRITVHADPDEIAVRIPRMETEAQCRFLEEELLPHVNAHAATTWVIDLSEHEEGATLGLVRMLAKFREEARRRDCEVKFTGLANDRMPFFTK